MSPFETRQEIQRRANDFAKEVDLEIGLPKIRQLLTVRETAEYIRCDSDHVYKLIDAGELIAENHALSQGGRRYIRIDRTSAINYRKRRRITS